MSDEDLLIGGKGPETSGANGSSGIQVPKEFVNASLFAVFKDSGNTKNVDDKTGDEYVEQKLPSVGRPKGTMNEDVAHYLWNKEILSAGVVRTVGSAGEINYYPLDRFKRFTFQISQVVGVTV